MPTVQHGGHYLTLTKTTEWSADKGYYETVRYFRAYPTPAASVEHYLKNLTYFDGITDWAKRYRQGRGFAHACEYWP